MSSEPQVTSGGAVPDSAERVLTRRQADRLPVYEAVERWLHREPAFLHEHEAEHDLEELALMTMAAEWLTRWQPISMHRALLAGAYPGPGRRGGRNKRAGPRRMRTGSAVNAADAADWRTMAPLPECKDPSIQARQPARPARAWPGLSPGRAILAAWLRPPGCVLARWVPR